MRLHYLLEDGTVVNISHCRYQFRGEAMPQPYRRFGISSAWDLRSRPEHGLVIEWAVSRVIRGPPSSSLQAAMTQVPINEDPAAAGSWQWGWPLVFTGNLHWDWQKRLYTPVSSSQVSQISPSLLAIYHQVIISNLFSMISTKSFLLPSLFLCTLAAAKTVTYNWSVGYVSVNPDGAAQRQAVGINGQWYVFVLSPDSICWLTFNC